VAHQQSPVAMLLADSDWLCAAGALPTQVYGEGIKPNPPKKGFGQPLGPEEISLGAPILKL